MKYLVLVLFLFITVLTDGQVITTFAGNGTSSGLPGDGGPATAASINGANGGIFDKDGNYYVCDVLGQRVRKITPSGIISTVAGNGISGFSGDGGPATAAQLSSPTKVLLDTFGNLYIDDNNNFRIRKVDGATTIITTIAGTGVSGYNGDSIPAISAQLGGVEDICFDRVGNLYLSDQVNNRVRKIDGSGTISTIAGHGGFSATGSGDGGPATAATFNWLAGIAIDDTGNVYVADFNGAKIRKVNLSGIITTIAGNGVYTYAGDNIPATAAQFNPLRITFNQSKNLVIADKYNKRILEIDESGIIHSIAGNGFSGYSGDGGPATAASLDFPAGVVYDTCDNLYIAESTNRRVRKVSFNPDCLPISVQDIQGNEAPHITLHPNPATETLTITAGVEVETVAILNTVGQVVKTADGRGRRQILLDVSSLPPGVYMVRVNEVWTGKFVKE